MIADPNYLIVYGTLRPPLANPFALYLQQQSQYVGEGSFTGQLVNISSYPGAIYSATSLTIVHGTVFNLTSHKGSTLSYLDNYEGVGNGFAQPTEFIRTVIPVSIHNQLIDCWFYQYNRSTEGRYLIESGDYVNYLASL